MAETAAGDIELPQAVHGGVAVLDEAAVGVGIDLQRRQGGDDLRGGLGGAHAIAAGEGTVGLLHPGHGDDRLVQRGLDLVVGGVVGCQSGDGHTGDVRVGGVTEQGPAAVSELCVQQDLDQLLARHIACGGVVVGIQRDKGEDRAVDALLLDIGHLVEALEQVMLADLGDILADSGEGQDDTGVLGGLVGIQAAVCVDIRLHIGQDVVIVLRGDGLTGAGQADDGPLAALRADLELALVGDDTAGGGVDGVQVGQRGLLGGLQVGVGLLGGGQGIQLGDLGLFLVGQGVIGAAGGQNIAALRQRHITDGLDLRIHQPAGGLQRREGGLGILQRLLGGLVGLAHVEQGGEIALGAEVGHGDLAIGLAGRGDSLAGAVGDLADGVDLLHDGVKGGLDHIGDDLAVQDLVSVVGIGRGQLLGGDQLVLADTGLHQLIVAVVLPQDSHSPDIAGGDGSGVGSAVDGAVQTAPLHDLVSEETPAANAQVHEPAVDQVGDPAPGAVAEVLFAVDTAGDSRLVIAQDDGVHVALDGVDDDGLVALVGLLLQDILIGAQQEVHAAVELEVLDHGGADPVAHLDHDLGVVALHRGAEGDAGRGQVEGLGQDALLLGAGAQGQDHGDLACIFRQVKGEVHAVLAGDQRLLQLGLAGIQNGALGTLAVVQDTLEHGVSGVLGLEVYLGGEVHLLGVEQGVLLGLGGVVGGRRIVAVGVEFENAVAAEAGGAAGVVAILAQLPVVGQLRLDDLPEVGGVGLIRLADGPADCLAVLAADAGGLVIADLDVIQQPAQVGGGGEGPGAAALLVLVELQAVDGAAAGLGHGDGGGVGSRSIKVEVQVQVFCRNDVRTSVETDLELIRFCMIEGGQSHGLAVESVVFPSGGDVCGHDLQITKGQTVEILAVPQRGPVVDVEPVLVLGVKVFVIKIIQRELADRTCLIGNFGVQTVLAPGNILALVAGSTLELILRDRGAGGDGDGHRHADGLPRGVGGGDHQGVFSGFVERLLEEPDVKVSRSKCLAVQGGNGIHGIFLAVGLVVDGQGLVVLNTAQEVQLAVRPNLCGAGGGGRAGDRGGGVLRKVSGEGLLLGNRDIDFLLTDVVIRIAIIRGQRIRRVSLIVPLEEQGLIVGGGSQRVLACPDKVAILVLAGDQTIEHCFRLAGTIGLRSDGDLGVLVIGQGLFHEVDDLDIHFCCIVDRNGAFVHLVHDLQLHLQLDLTIGALGVLRGTGNSSGVERVDVVDLLLNACGHFHSLSPGHDLSAGISHGCGHAGGELLQQGVQCPCSVAAILQGQGAALAVHLESEYIALPCHVGDSGAGGQGHADVRAALPAVGIVRIALGGGVIRRGLGNGGGDGHAGNNIGPVAGAVVFGGVIVGVVAIAVHHVDGKVHARAGLRQRHYSFLRGCVPLRLVRQGGSIIRLCRVRHRLNSAVQLRRDGLCGQQPQHHYNGEQQRKHSFLHVRLSLYKKYLCQPRCG